MIRNKSGDAFRWILANRSVVENRKPMAAWIITEVSRASFVRRTTFSHVHKVQSSSVLRSIRPRYISRPLTGRNSSSFQLNSQCLPGRRLSSHFFFGSPLISRQLIQQQLGGQQPLFSRQRIFDINQHATGNDVHYDRMVERYNINSKDKHGFNAAEFNVEDETYLQLPPNAIRITEPRSFFTEDGEISEPFTKTKTLIILISGTRSSIQKISENSLY